MNMRKFMRVVLSGASSLPWKAPSVAAAGLVSLAVVAGLGAPSGAEARTPDGGEINHVTTIQNHWGVGSPLVLTSRSAFIVNPIDGEIATGATAPVRKEKSLPGAVTYSIGSTTYRLLIDITASGKASCKIENSIMESTAAPFACFASNFSYRDPYIDVVARDSLRTAKTPAMGIYGAKTGTVHGACELGWHSTQTIVDQTRRLTDEYGGDADSWLSILTTKSDDAERTSRVEFRVRNYSPTLKMFRGEFDCIPNS